MNQMFPKYKNVTHNDIELYNYFSELCQRKQKVLKNSIVVNPMDLHDFNSRSQVYVIDFLPRLDTKCKFLKMYQDHLT